MQAWKPGDLTSLDYTDEQQSVLCAAFASSAASLSGLSTYTLSDSIQYGGTHTYALFGTTACKLLGYENRVAEITQDRYEYLPAVHEGRMLLQTDEHGHFGLLYLMRMTHLGGQSIESAWAGVFIPVSWCHAETFGIDEEAFHPPGAWAFSACRTLSTHRIR